MVYELATRLAARGHAVTVCTTDVLDATHRVPAGRHLVEGVTVHRFRNLSNALAWNRLFMPVGMGRGVVNLLPDIDVVHIHEVRSLLNALSLPGLLRRQMPYIVTAHGGLPAELGRTAYKHVYDALVGRRLLGNACCLHALTPMERQQYINAGLSEERVVLIPNGVDTSAFNAMANVAAFKRRWNIPEDRPLVGFLGRLNPIKGVDFLIEAFAKVLRSSPTALLLIVGPDDGAQAQLEAQVERLSIGEAVRFVGMISDDESRTAAYRALNVYVLPSRYENLPTTVLEALGNATPCIVTDRCGLAAQLGQDEVVQVVPFGDTEALAGAILKLLNHPTEAVAQGKRGKRYISEHFNWEAVIDRWMEVYCACAERTP